MPCSAVDDLEVEAAAPAGHFAERCVAWKYLLPRAEGGDLLAIGFSAVAVAGFTRSWPRIRAVSGGWASTGSPVGESRSASWPAVAVTADSRSARPQPADLLHLVAPGGAVAWAGKGQAVPTDAALSAAGFEFISRHAALPPGTMKVLVPLSSGRATRAALNLYIPGGRLNRARVVVMRVLARFGLQRLLGRSQVVIARRPGRLAQGDYLLDWLGIGLGRPVAEAAIYPGTNDAPGRRKVTLQLLDAEGRVMGIAKVADTDPAAAALEREAVLLDRLRRDPALADSIPRIAARGDWHGHAIQVQTPLEHTAASFRPVWTARHQEFMDHLAAIDTVVMPLDRWPGLPRLLGWVRCGAGNQPGPGARERQAVERAVSQLADVRLPCHRVHGDFTPWNVFAHDDRIMVFDWEDSEAQGLPLSDLFHFRVIAETCLRRPYTTERLFASTPRSLGIEEQLNRFCDALAAHNPGRPPGGDLPTAFFHLLAAAECCRPNSPIDRHGAGQ
jgi:hypothetical protein